MSLHRLVGHESVRASLLQAHSAGALPQALLLHGMRGVGKQHLALWLARLSVCLAPTEQGPCEVCGPCRMATSLEHPDIHWYFPLPRPKGVSGDRLASALERDRFAVLDEVRSNPIRASVRDAVAGIQLATISNLRSAASKRPTMARGPVFVIGQAELLVPQESSAAAANALLKLLEEPPGEARFILTSSEAGSLLPTIRSRTVPIHVPPLSDDEVEAFLAEHTDIDAKRRSWAAGLALGSPGRALGFLPDGDELGKLDELRRRAFTLVESALSPAGAGHAVAAGYPPAGARGLIDLFAFVEEWLRDLSAVSAGVPERAIHGDAAERMSKMVDTHDVRPAAVAGAFNAVEDARELAKGNVNPQLIVAGLVRDLRRHLRWAQPASAAS